MVMVSVGPLLEARFDPPDRLCEREKNAKRTRRENTTTSQLRSRVRPAMRPAGKKKKRDSIIARTDALRSGSR
jgi:hypothetical protein